MDSGCRFEQSDGEGQTSPGKMQGTRGGNANRTLRKGKIPSRGNRDDKISHGVTKKLESSKGHEFPHGEA